MRFRSWRSCTITALVGVTTVPFPYWHCAACGTSSRGYADRWALPDGGFSFGVQTLGALAGTVLPFKPAADLLERMTGLTVSARSLEGWTEQMGAAYVPPVPGPHDPGPEADLLVIEADAVMTCFRDGWHEEKVAMAWRVVDGVAEPARYVTGEGSWEDFAPALARLGRREGSRRAMRIACINDGAHPIWKVVTRLYPDAFQLLDWYHVQEHLAEVAKVLKAAGAKWHAAQREALRERGPRETLRALARLTQRGKTAIVRTAARACFRYLWRHRHRLDYPTARRLGIPIGSGRIESTCKQLVQQRAKLAGMRWSHPHLQHVLAARCAFYNGDWDRAVQQYCAAA